MNPNLNYAQFIPGTQNNSGRPSGLIDSYSFVDMLNAVKLLEDSKSYTLQDRLGLEEWFSYFATWWQNSDLGKVERAQNNNHGTTYDMQLTVFLLFAAIPSLHGKLLMNSLPVGSTNKYNLTEANPANCTGPWLFITLYIISNSS